MLKEFTVIHDGGDDGVDDDIYVECPHCGNGEGHPGHEHRHHLQTFSIVDWFPDKEGEHEKSLTKCLHCKEQFIIIWDYSDFPEEVSIEPDEYAEKGKDCCPVCKTNILEADEDGREYISYGDKTHENGYMMQAVNCRKCESSWDEFYKLDGYTNLKRKMGERHGE